MKLEISEQEIAETSLINQIPPSQKITLFVVGILGVYVASLIASLILGAFPAMEENLSNAYFQMIAFTILTAAMVFCLFYNTPQFKNIFKQCKRPGDYLEGLILGLALIGGTILVSIIMQEIGQALGVEMVDNANEQEIDKIVAAAPALSFIITVFLAPFCEEVTYRVGLFGSLKKHNRVLAYVATSLIFGFIHFNYNNDLANEFLNLPVYLFAGFFLSYCYERRGSMVTAVIAHMVNNFVSGLSSFV